jgi:hypothetical protein
MKEEHMRKSTLIGAVASIFGLLIAFAMVAPASAAPVGAATNLSFSSQVCHSNGTVSGSLRWTASGLGSQYVDLAVDAGFNNYSRGGPYANSAAQVSLTQLKPGTTYYARVLTATSGGTLFSDTLVVTASSCTGGGGTGAITKPTGLTAVALSGSSLRVDWNPGNNNIWYCVDTARTLNDLLTVSNTWRNHGCWTTNSILDVTGLQCGTAYYVLVYAWNQTSNVKSDPIVAQTASCQSTISAPGGLSATVLNNGNVFFDWSAGQGNIWYCVDTAKSQSDLLNLSNTWRNHGCWNTNTELVVAGLECGETYYWLVYAWNNSANVKSNVSSVQTQACAATLQQAPIVDVEVVKSGSNYRADIIAALPNGCHSPDSHLVQRTGNTINITVWNLVQPGLCTFVYNEYQLNINLGSDFVSGQTYTVIVNGDESDTFTAD